jgi:excinuclease ABC subunit C
LLRNCSDGVFRARTRPCLQYQIKRCSAPCVGFIDEADYADTVDQAKAFLAGRSQEVKDALAKDMQAAAESLDFERAAALRDRLRAMAHVQSSQDVNIEGVGDADVVALEQRGGQSCIQVFFYRGGRNNGNRAYFPSHDRQLEPSAVIAGFLGQFYENRPPPKDVLLSHDPDELALLSEALTVKAGRKVTIATPKRGGRRKAVEMAADNAREALERRLAESSSQRKLLNGLADLVGLDGPAGPRRGVRQQPHPGAPSGRRHDRGGSRRVFESPLSKVQHSRRGVRDGARGGSRREDAASYTAAPSGGDDYAMTREVIQRRFARALKEDPDRETTAWPDLVILDGGKGQLSAASEALAELGLEDEVAVMAVAKGPEREAGRERIFLPGRDAPILLPPRIRCCTSFSASGTRRTASRSDRTGNAARGIKPATRWTKSPGSGPSERRRFCYTSGRRRRSRARP